jgi:uncharacterized integral membrane protein
MTDSPAAQPERVDQPGRTPTARHGRNPLRVTALSGAWVGLIAAAIVLVLLLIFILQNTKSVSVSYLGASGMLPLGVAMLLAAVAGVLIAVIAGSLRIWQLRRYLRRSTRHH